MTMPRVDQYSTPEQEAPLALYARVGVFALLLGLIRAVVGPAAPIAGLVIGVGSLLVLIWMLRRNGWSNAALQGFVALLVGNVLGRLVALFIGMA